MTTADSFAAQILFRHGRPPGPRSTGADRVAAITFDRTEYGRPLPVDAGEIRTRRTTFRALSSSCTPKRAR
jgi:hypothetical protein